MARPFGVGIVGLQPRRSWAALAHLPALNTLPDQFRIAGIANSTFESAERAVAEIGVDRAFASVEALVECDAVDLVVVTVKVPHHAAIVRAAVAAGKHVFCEWPLGRTLAEAEELAALAEAAGVIAVVGTQAVMAPAVTRLAQLRDTGALGSLRSATILGNGMSWGASVEPDRTYLLDRTNGATMLTIAVGHVLSAVERSIGRVIEVNAMLATRCDRVRVSGTGEALAMTAPDQILLQCRLEGDVPLSLHYRGGPPRGSGLFWEVEGAERTVRVTASSGLVEMTGLTLTTVDGDVIEAPVDQPLCDGVARLYAGLARRMAGEEVRLPTFADAVALHRVIDAVERSAETGRRVTVER